MREIQITQILSKSAGNCELTDKQKTEKVREIQIILILLVSLSISYNFCALDFSELDHH